MTDRTDEMVATFSGRTILILGFGSVAVTLLPLLLRHVRIVPGCVRIISDTDDNIEVSRRFGVRHDVVRIDESNYDRILKGVIAAGDLLINLTIGVDTVDLIRFCDYNSVDYIDTGSESWAARAKTSGLNTFTRRERLIHAAARLTGASTVLANHGANPGLVSHFLKRSLRALAEPDPAAYSFVTGKREDWGAIAKHLGVSRIYISEIDTQHAEEAGPPDELVNTWSVDGFIEECNELCCFAWGSHEQDCPGLILTGTACQAVLLRELACQKSVESWTPSIGRFSGFLVPHPEAFSMAQFLASNFARAEFYQPTILFCYRPSDLARASLRSCKALGDRAPKRVLSGEIRSGFDELGVVVSSVQSGKSYWYGSHLSIQESRQLSPYGNATTMQVAAGVLSGTVWILENPKRGFVEPEDIDLDLVLRVAGPYLGQLYGTEVEDTNAYVQRACERKVCVPSIPGNVIDWDLNGRMDIASFNF